MFAVAYGITGSTVAYLAPGEMFDNMLRLMRFSVYFEGLLKTNGYFHIKIVISAAHMLGDSWACPPPPPPKKFEKKQLGAF